jgi:hypothetical protein
MEPTTRFTPAEIEQISESSLFEPCCGLHIENVMLSMDQELKIRLLGPRGCDWLTIGCYIGIANYACKCFQPPEEDLRFTLFDNNIPIGTDYSNKWINHLANTNIALQQMKNEYIDDLTYNKICIFIDLLLVVIEKEKELRQTLVDEGINEDEVVHRCGITIHREYTVLNLGLMDKCVEVSDELIVDKTQCKAIVVKSTNSFSKKVFVLNGYELYWSISYKECGIPLNGRYSILIKRFN